jgi:hypothetical protein
MWTGGHEELYDLWQDPHELTNLARVHGCQPVLDDMRLELLRRWFDVEPQSLRRTGNY